MATVKPADALLWATAVTANKTAPDTAHKVTNGWLPSENPPAEYWNYVWNVQGDWNTYLDERLDALPIGGGAPEDAVFSGASDGGAVFLTSADSTSATAKDTRISAGYGTGGGGDIIVSPGVTGTDPMHAATPSAFTGGDVFIEGGRGGLNTGKGGDVRLDGGSAEIDAGDIIVQAGSPSNPTNAGGTVSISTGGVLGALPGGTLRGTMSLTSGLLDVDCTSVTMLCSAGLGGSVAILAGSSSDPATSGDVGIEAGSATGGTDHPGGDVNISSGDSTGVGFSHVALSASGRGLASGTGVQPATERVRATYRGLEMRSNLQLVHIDESGGTPSTAAPGDNNAICIALKWPSVIFPAPFDGMCVGIQQGGSGALGDAYFSSTIGAAARERFIGVLVGVSAGVFPGVDKYTTVAVSGVVRAAVDPTSPAILPGDFVSLSLSGAGNQGSRITRSTPNGDPGPTSIGVAISSSAGGFCYILLQRSNLA